jgi:hypothetical protein
VASNQSSVALLARIALLGLPRLDCVAWIALLGLLALKGRGFLAAP